MKGATIVLLIALIGLSYQQADYTSPGTIFTDPNCAADFPTLPRLQSPIMIQSTKCGSYDEFSLTFSSSATGGTTNDPTKGAQRLDYTDGKLVVNGKSYTSQYIVLRLAAEHVLYSADNRDALEIQIYFQNDADASDRAAVALLVKEATTAGETKAMNNLKILPDDNALGATWNLNLPAVSTAIQNKLAKDVFLNFYTYQGTETFPGGTCAPVTWYVYASEFYTTGTAISNARAALNTGAANPAATTQNARPYNTAAGYQPATRLCYTGYFKVRMDANYGLWFAIGILLLFFIFTLSMDNTPINSVDYRENGWTHHPLYSIWKVGNDIFTKKSRASLVLVTCINSALWNSVFYRVASNQTAGENVITFALASMGIGWVVHFLFSYWLRKYYLEKHRYEETNDEKYDNKAQFYIFIYYFLIFAFIWVGFGFTIWNMNELKAYVDQKPSNLWVASFFVTLALDWLLFDILSAWLCVRWTKWRNWCKWKAFIYDDICHDTYLRSIKRE